MIIEVSNQDQFDELVKTIPIERFKLFISEDDEILIRPSVTSKAMDTILWKNPTKDAVDTWSELGGRVFKIKKFYWREDQAPEFQYRREE